MTVITLSAAASALSSVRQSALLSRKALAKLRLRRGSSPTRRLARSRRAARGVAQHRERVFVVGCPRNGPDPREVLFERTSESGHRQAFAGSPRHREEVVAARLGDRRPAVYLNADATPKWAVEQAYTPAQRAVQEAKPVSSSMDESAN